MTTPLLPDIASVDTFGGNAHVDADPVVDPASEYSSSDLDRLITQAAMSALTQPRAWARIAVSGGVATLADHSAVWGDSPSVAPTITHGSAGDFFVIWAASYDDLQATPESHSVNIRSVNATCSLGLTDALFCNPSITSATSVHVHCFNAAGTAKDPSQLFVTVW